MVRQVYEVVRRVGSLTQEDQDRNLGRSGNSEVLGFKKTRCGRHAQQLQSAYRHALCKVYSARRNEVGSARHAGVPKVLLPTGDAGFLQQMHGKLTDSK